MAVPESHPPAEIPAGPLNPFKNLKTREFVGHKKKLQSVRWNLTGLKLATGSFDETVRIWNIERGMHKPCRELELRGHSGSCDNLAWAPHSPDLLTSVSSDKTVRLWDTRSGRCERSITVSDGVINVAYRPDGCHLAVGTEGDELHFMDVRKFQVIHKRKFKREVNEFMWDRTGELLFVTSGSGLVEVMDYDKMVVVDNLAGHTAGVYSLALHPDNKYLAAGGADALLSLWDINSMLCARVFCNLEYPIRTASFSHDGRYLAAGSEDEVIDIAEVETGDSVHRIKCKATLNSVDWNPKFDLIAYATDGDENKTGVAPGNFHVFGFDN